MINTLKLLETYLPDIMRSVHEKLKTARRGEWTENESRKLDVALRFYPTYDFIRDSEERWRHIHGFVNTKTIIECKEEVQLQEVGLTRYCRIYLTLGPKTLNDR